MYDLKGKTAGILVRISDDREGRALGVQRQEIDCLQLITRLQLRLSKVYVENDVSASAIADSQREDFEDFIADWESGKFDVPVAYTTSRLTRDNMVAERIIRISRKKGISPCYYASPWCDLNTAAGRRMYRGLAVNDTGESEDISERITRKKKADAEEGSYPGGRRCFAIGELVGTHPKTGKEVRDWTKLDQAEADILREMSSRMLQGDTQFELARDLFRRGIRTSMGYAWDVGRIKRTLLNASYVQFDMDDPDKRGTRQHKGDRHRAIWPAIFTQAEHEAMKRCFSNSPYAWQEGKIIARSYVLSGFVVCGSCGGLMYGQARTERGKRVRRYHCKKWNNRGEQVGCGRIFRIAEPVEELVKEAVLYRFDSPEVAQALAPAEDKARVQELTQKYLALQTRRKNLAMEHAITPYEDYGLMLATIKERMDVVQHELDKLRSERAKIAMVPALGNIRARYETASIEWQAAVIKLLVKRVVIKPSGHVTQLWNGRKFDPESVEIDWAC